MSLESKDYHNNVPFILTQNQEKKYRILAYDLFMFLQLIMFYVLCFTLGLLCLTLDKITFQKIFFNSFINTFSIIANIGKAP